MAEPIVLTHNPFLNRIHYLEEREKELSQQLECVHAERAQLVDQLRLRVAGTGNPRLNFVISICEGIHDRTIERQYKDFEEDFLMAYDGLHKRPRIMLLVQTARHIINRELVYLRCVHLVAPADRPIAYNPFYQSVEIPVERMAYIRSELVRTSMSTVTTHDGLLVGDCLSVGPLKNERCHAPIAMHDQAEYRVPFNAPFTYAFCPWEYDKNMDHLAHMHVDKAFVDDCMREWSKHKTRFLRYGR